MTGSRLELLHISFIINVRESLIHYHGSKVLLLQPKPTVIMCFVCTKQSKSSITKVMFKQATNCYKRFLEAAKPHYANKVEEFVTFIKVDKSWLTSNSLL